MSQAKVMLHFEIVRDGQVVGREQLDQDVIKVGKLSSSHLRLEDPNVSRIHAVIERGGDGSYTVIDLGSASGTFVNGEKVTKAELNDGDELQFGDTLLRVSMVAAAPEAPAAAVPALSFGENEATVVSQGLDQKLADDQSRGSHEGGVNGSAAMAAPVSQAQIQLPDGTLVQPYTMEGYYDDGGNYIPGYYDEYGQYHHGYGYYDDDGAWQVTQGYYDPEGEWIAADEEGGAEYYDEGPSDTEYYTESFFSEKGGDTLEIAFLWSDHVLSVTNYAKPRTITVGEAETNDFTVQHASLPAAAFPILSFTEGEGYRLNITADMVGTIQNGDEQYTVEQVISGGAATRSAEFDGAYSLPIGAKTSARLDVGSNTFLIHFTSVPVLVGGTLPIDKAPIPYLTASATAHILFLLLAMSMPDSARSLNLDGFDANDRFVQLLIKPDQEEEEDPPDWLGGDEEEAAKHKGEEGQAGKEDSQEVDKELQIEGPQDNTEIELKKARDTEIAMNAGALAVFNENQISSLWGGSDQSVGSDAMHALGNLTGDGPGEASGMGGLGLAGAGRGGGGVSERGIGLANVGTAGRGGGGRGGSGYGKGQADLGDRSTIQPKIVPGRPNVQGSLDREIIRRVVRQHRREIQYCYESELQKNRNLAGRITVRFTISATGSVVSAVVSETSMNNANVERCMAERIRRWVFPEPKGGGIVIVNYPFNFST